MITVQHVSKSIRSRLIVDDASFDVPDGSITGFVGPNGAGKTTTMRIALGLTRADSGAVHFDGVAYGDLATPLRTVGSLLDAGRMFPSLRARDVLEYCARTQGVPTRTAERLAMVGLSGVADRRVRHLSLGMRQRLGIAVALVASPRHLILDEPLNGLDPDGISWLRDLLRSLRDDGCAILLSSHIVSELALIADDVVVIADGRVVLKGPLSDLAALGQSRVLARTERPAALVAAVRAHHGGAQSAPGEPVQITGLTPREVFHIAATEGLTLDELVGTRRTLDDIYRESVGATTSHGQDLS